jgi:hypothetical protein
VAPTPITKEKKEKGKGYVVPHPSQHKEVEVRDERTDMFAATPFALFFFQFTIK